MHAELECEFEGGRGTTVFRTLRQDPPWKVVRGFSLGTGECLVHLNNVSGGVFGGDSLQFAARLYPEAEAQITTTGATRLYRPRAESAETHLNGEFHLGKGSLLEYVPDALIPYREVRARQRTAFHLEPGSSLFAWDTVAPGRVASGELFAYESLRLSLELTVCGCPILSDRLLFEPGRWPVGSPGRLGPHTGYHCTFLAAQAGASTVQLRDLERSLNELLTAHAETGDFWGASALSAHGVLVRGLSASPLHLPGLLYRLWSHAKDYLLGREATPPRKTY